ncbi:MAG: peptidoglycan-binding protein [Candidatus Cryptobacteroides sp.]
MADNTNLDEILKELFTEGKFAAASQKSDTEPQKTAVAPGKTAAAPEKTTVAPEKTATAPEKTAVAPEKTAVAPEKTATAPQKTASDSLKAGQNATKNTPAHYKGETINIGGKNYTIVDILGSGAEGELYVVADGKKKYALKLYRKGRNCNGKILSAVKSINGKGYIAETIDYGDGFELMEYITEGNAATAGIKGNAQAILAVAVKTAMALDKLHSIGILHKDIKPANILIRDKESWDSVLCDFGIADLLDKDGKCATLQVRTPIYAAPEVYTDSITLDNKVYIELTPKADFYSLGMTILSLWMGESAFLAKESQLAIDKVKGRITVPADMPDPLARICRGLLIKNPAKRWDLPEIERTLNGEDIPVEEDEILEDLNITFSASKHLTANTPEELAQCMLRDEDLAIKYLYRGQVEKWLKPYPELVLEIQEIVEKRYPKDQKTGLMAAVYTLDPTIPFALSGVTRKTKEEFAVKAVTLKEIGDFCNKAVPSGDTISALCSDIFVEWVRIRNPKLAAELPRRKSEVETFMLRVQTVDPMSDINLINDPSDEHYAMTQEKLGELLDTIYNIFWNKYKIDIDELVNNWYSEENASVNNWLLIHTVINVTSSFITSKDCSYITDFFASKGTRFARQESWFRHCMDFESSEYKRKAGPKDKRYNVQMAWMKIVKGYGYSPTYIFPESGKTARTSTDIFSRKKKELREEYESGGLRGWLAVQHHEDPSANLSSQFAYEKLLHDYLEDLRKIDPELKPVKRFDEAKKEAGRILSEGQGKVRALSTRSAVQHILSFFLGALPAIVLMAMLIFSIIENPLLPEAGNWMDKLFWPLGLIVAAVIFFASDSDGCVVPIIGGVIATFIIIFVLKILGTFILYLFLALVVAELIYFSRKTLFFKSIYAKDAKKFTKPGFDEEVLEPLYYAFNNDSYFDSSLNGAFSDDDLEGWEKEIKRRRRHVLLFVVSSVILSVFSAFIPSSRFFEKFTGPIIEKVIPASQADLLQFESLNPGDKSAEVVELQQYLKEAGYFSGNTTGLYGKQTEAAVRAFQKDNGISQSGIADKATIKKINELAAK